MTESQYKHTLGAVRALSKKSFEVHTFGRRMGQASLSRAIKSSTIVNYSSNEQLVTALLQTLDIKGIDALLPIGSESVSVIQEHRELFSEKVRFALAPNESLTLALDKSRTLDRARELGIECPETWIFPTLEIFKAEIPKLKLPLVVKSASEISKFGPYYLYSSADLEKLLLRFELSETFLTTSMIVQKIVRGPGLGFFALYQEGSCKRLFMHQRIRETPSSGGSSWAAKGLNNHDLEEAGLKLLDSLNWHGPAMVEFKLDESTGRPSLMELNPKFWGSLDLAIESGVDFPSDTVRVALGDSLKANFEFDSKKFFVWPLEEPSKFLRDREIQKPIYQTNIKFSDPAPALYQSLQKFVLSVTSKSALMSNLLYWSSRYDINGVLARFVGQVLGIPIQQHSRITDNIWVGAKPNRLGEMFLKFRGCTLRASLIDGDPPGNYSPLKTLFLPLEEFVAIPTEKLWEYTDLLLLELEGERKKVFIHCREGVGRAPALAAALLMRKGRKADEAINLVQKGRTVTNMNQLQLHSLEKFYREVCERGI